MPFLASSVKKRDPFEGKSAWAATMPKDLKNSYRLTVPELSSMLDDLPAIRQRGEALLAIGETPRGFAIWERVQTSALRRQL
jgi:hypothetical protein